MSHVELTHPIPGVRRGGVAAIAVALLAVATLAVVTSSVLYTAVIAGGVAYVAGIAWLFRNAEEAGGECDRMEDILTEQERRRRLPTGSSSATGVSGPPPERR